MRKIFAVTILSVLLSAPSLAGAKRIIPMNYSVVSKEKDKSIEKGQFKLKGMVKTFSAEIPVENVLIGCTSSGIWTRSDEEGLFEITLNVGDEPIYFYKEGWTEIVIEESFEERMLVTVDVWMNQGKTETVRKPVIYLYSEENLTASVKVYPKGEFTFTYPQYNDGWEVDVNKDGLKDQSGNTYPYLFWEAETDQLFYEFHQGQMEGFVINTDTATQFLESQLELLGLNETEMTDFITFWGPILEKKPFALVQFFVDDKYDEHIGELVVEPKPDATRRVFILCSGLNTAVVGMDVIPQKLAGFERTGFTVLEWGGTEIDLNIIKP